MHRCKMCETQISDKRTYCSNTCKFSDKDYSLKRGNKDNLNDNSLEIKCLFCEYKSRDINNYSGTLTRHLKEKHKWDFDAKYFEIIKSIKKETLKCPHCDWTTIDIENKSGMFTNHLKNKHHLEPKDIIEKYPEMKSLWQQYFKKIEYNKFLSESDKNSIKCEICGNFLKKLTNSHLEKHNISPSKYKSQYSIVSTSSKLTCEKQSFQTKKSNARLVEYYKNNNIKMPWHTNEANIKKLKIVFDKYLDSISNNFVINITFEQFKNHEEIKFRCKKCNYEFETINRYPRCYSCELRFNSKEQIEIRDFIKSLNLNVEENSRKLLGNGMEIDLFIPEKNVGIEYNGLYWHSELNGKNRNYHLEKTLFANKNNIKLIQIFSDEWLYKKDIVKNRLKYILGIYDKIIYARKCIIKEIDIKSKNEFLHNIHIQGKDSSKIKLGAFHKNELVAVMTFGSKRIALGSKSKIDEYDLMRFATKYKVIGIAGKLLQYFINNYHPKKIITYADRRWSTGNLYEKIGFLKTGESKPNYWYVKRDYDIREYRFGYRKSILLKEGYSSDLSEWQIMQIKGYDRVWDCGNLKYELIFENINL